MPEFSTPTPIDLAVNLPVGIIEVVASDRDTTVVTVVPTNPAKAVDRRGAAETKVEFDGQRLTVIGPRPRISWIGPSESVDLKIELPTGSRLSAELSMGNVRTLGTLGATRIKASMGAVDVASTGDLWVRAGHGNVTAEAVAGGLTVTADHGQIRIGRVDGDAVLKASYGSITVAQSGGELDAKLSYGDIGIDRAAASVAVKSAYGSVRLAEVASGSVQIEGGFGNVEVGVLPGVPAWLDLASKDGRVRNELDGDRAPDAPETAVAVRVRTRGDITITRAR